MATVTAHVWYKVSGNIVAVGQPVGDLPVTPLGDETTSVLVTEVDADYLDKLHETHIVNSDGKLAPNAENGQGS